MKENAEKRLAEIRRQKKIDAVVFFGLENIRYLCGFTGSDGVLICAPSNNIFLSDSRYQEQAKGEIENALFKKYTRKMEGLTRTLRTLRVRRIGIEASAISYEGYQQLRTKLPRVTLVPIGKELVNLRVCKTPKELGSIRQAIQIASTSFAEAVRLMKPGFRERRVADFLEYRMIRKGGDKPSFDTIVASGVRAALPHGKASEKTLQENETVVVDFGTRYRGYHSDETKTMILGKPSAEQKRIYDTVRRAQERAFQAIRPGAAVRKIDAAAREVIGRAGYGKFFGHGTGHGVGLAVHEAPTLSPRGEGVVEAGMVFTVEPGIYLPGWGGVRLEDMVRVTDRGFERLTFLAKNLSENILP